MINRMKQEQIARDIQKALAEVAERHGLSAPNIDVRRDRAGTFVRLMKTDMFVAEYQPAHVVIASSPDSMLQSGMTVYGIARTTNAKGEKLVEYKPNRHKYPFVMEGPRGGRWKLSAMEAKLRFG